MVAHTPTSSTSPGFPEMTDIYSKKMRLENLPELLMERNVQLKDPETMEGPPKGASVRDQCHVQPHKGKGGPGSPHQSQCIGELSSGKLGPQGTIPLMLPCKTVTAGSTLALNPETCPLKKACDLLGECLCRAAGPREKLSQSHGRLLLKTCRPQ